MLVVYCQFYSSPFKSAYWFTMSSQQKSIILNWNVWGLNNPARRQVVQDLVADHRCDIVCLQETKIQAMDDSVVTATLGQDFCQHYAAFPVAGTRGGGGGVLASSGRAFTMAQATVRTYSVTAIISRLADNAVWTVTGVYGPQEDTDKPLLTRA
jgi:exonuclease III